MNSMQIRTLGEARFASPLSYARCDSLRIAAEIVRDPSSPPREEALMELAGPRAKLFFDPRQTVAGIVTCGGLCPGLNNVIRSIFLELHHRYGVARVLGFRGGYAGLLASAAQPPVELTPEMVSDVHRHGGTILGTSRGPVDVAAAVDNLIRLGVNILFAIGGDGTQRGANALYEEATRRGHTLSVVGVPKTVDNDVAFVDRTFGYQTAVEEARAVIDRAHTEAQSVENGIALVKLMGRHAGFIAAGATLASQDVNFTLIPEVPFCLEGEKGFLAALKRRVAARGHAVIVVAEGAGQDLLDGEEKFDASGNRKLKDIGPFLKERIEASFKAAGIASVIRYFDPSYFIRSSPADAEDSILCDLFARNAVHAAMAGKTGLVVGVVHNHFVHVPIGVLVQQKRRVYPDGQLWQAVLSVTGQPERFE